MAVYALDTAADQRHKFYWPSTKHASIPEAFRKRLCFEIKTHTAKATGSCSWHFQNSYSLTACISSIHEEKSSVVTIFFCGRIGGHCLTSNQSPGQGPAEAARNMDDHGVCQASIRRQSGFAGIASLLLFRGRPHSGWRGRSSRLMLCQGGPALLSRIHRPAPRSVGPGDLFVHTGRGDAYGGSHDRIH